MSRNFAYPLRPGLQPRVAGPPMRERIAQSGPAGGSSGRRPAPPPTSHRSDRMGLPQGPIPKYVSRPDDETKAQPTVAYRPIQPVGPQPRYYPSAEQYDSTSLGTHPSMQSDRSIYIGYDPSSDQAERDPNRLTPNFPAQASSQQRRPVGNASPPSALRAVAPPYYSQQTMQIPPIPEESPYHSRHASYASSSAIPSSWVDTEESASDRENALPIQRGSDVEAEGENNGELVRHASLGKRQKPTLTNIKSPERSRSRATSGASSSQLAKTPPAVDREPMARGDSPVLYQVSTSSGSRPSPTLSKASIPSTLPQSPLAANNTYFSEKPVRGRAYSDTLPAFLDKEIGGASSEPTFPPKASTRKGSRSEEHAGRIPPRLNMEAVREAEARGSLTSLPDLIRRATKLAAALETGRPGSTAWGGRGSLFGFSGSSAGRSNGRSRDTDSISEILASFPPPALGAQRSRDGNRGSTLPSMVSEWPIAADCGYGTDNGSIRQVKPRRRICGLPLWAFIVLVILALVVITAAVIVPIQLANLSKSGKNNGNAQALENCKKTNPCQNGGENLATSNFCGCICTNGFTGSLCQTKEPDASCGSYDFAGRGNNSSIAGLKNATIGSALPRLFNKSSSYNIGLDPSLLLGVFSQANLTCTLQNALINFDGETEPISHKRALKIIRSLRIRQIDIDTSTNTPTATSTSTWSSATATSSGVPVLNQDTLDFARVGVLFLAQNDGVGVAETAHEDLDATFRDGTDRGNVTTGKFTFKLDSRSIVLSDGKVVGGV